MSDDVDEVASWLSLPGYLPLPGGKPPFNPELIHDFVYEEIAE